MFRSCEHVALVLVCIHFATDSAYGESAPERGSVTKATSSGSTPDIDSDRSLNNAGNFDKMMQVLTHPRCVNCHPNDGIPKQGDDGHPHYFGIAAGSKNLGFTATKCNTCHQEDNDDYSGVPGAPKWSLAPESMKWEGLSRVEIARSMLDPKRNGGRTPDEVMHHLTEHALVLWAWKPGIDASGKPRQKPPVPEEEFIRAVKEWFADGAAIPPK